MTPRSDNAHAQPPPGIRTWLGALLLCLAAVPVSAAATDSREYQIKAAFLYNFTRFVEWPASTFADTGGAIVIGTACADPFSELLERLVAGRTVDGRAIIVRKLDSVGAASATHLVFICAGDALPRDRIEASVDGAPVLTVGDDAGGKSIIAFGVERDKVRFDIDVAAAERAGLRISAQLQKLARTVKRS
jgi:hypothetical protein